MRGLNQFMAFNWPAFAADKTFLVCGLSEYQDYTTKAHIGTKVDCVIAVDNTKYAAKDGKTITNRYEKVTFKVAKDVDIPIDTKVVPKNAVATIYGDYRNQLSIKCDDIIIVPIKDKG